ncbi:MAG: hypothetical protein PSV46_19535 [Reyranella sp.]|nr:hypothetical protein [Reyranella sp.]
MKKLTVLIATAATCFALPTFAATDADCQAMWKKADVNNDGTLSVTESVRYAAAMRVKDYKMAADGTLTQATFMEACKADVYAPRKADEGAPLKGANSFTEGQAKDRAEAQGFVSVSGLTKDGDGIWRGNAMQDGKSTPIAVDFKGNVVAQPAR